MNLPALSTRSKILIGIGGVVLLAVVFFGWQGVRAYVAWNSVERVEFDLGDARAALPTTTAPRTPFSSTTTTVVEYPTTYRTVLVLGSDEKPSDVQESSFADAVLLYLVPDDGSAPIMVSIPRDLLLVDPCTGEVSKVNRMLVPCGEDISGPEHVALAMEDAVGIPIDHFALVRFETFQDVVDSVDGIQICVPYAMRERQYDIAPAGCSTIDGEHALAFIRSRATQEFVDGEWHFSDQLGDSARVGRHSIVLFALLDRLADMRSPIELAAIAEEVGDSVVLSETIGIGDAIAMAWELRARRASVRTFTLPGEGTNLADGGFAVQPSMTVRELIEN